MVKKFLCICLMITLTLSLAACGGKDENGSKNTGSKKEDNMEELYGKHWNEDHDFDGRVFKVASTSKWDEPMATNNYTEDFIERIEYYEDKWNFTIEWTVPSSDSTEYYSLINSSVASGKPLADLAYINTWQLFPSYVKGGIVQNLNDLNVFDWKDEKWNINQMDTLCSYKDKYYGTYPIGTLWCYDIGWGIFFNKTMAETYKFPDLYDLVNNNEWTWDKMLEVAKASSVDKDNNGTNDIYGFTAWMDAFPFIYANGGSVVEKNDDGTYRFAGADDKAVSAMEYYFDHFATSGSSETAVDKYPYVLPQKGKQWDFAMTGFANQEVYMCSAAFWVGGSYFLNMSDEWGWVPFPKVTADSDYVSYRESSTAISILNNVENPADVALVFDAITDVKIDDDIYSAYLADQLMDDESMDMMETMLKSGGVKYCRMESFDGLTNYFWQAWDKVREGNGTPRSAMDSIKDAAQSKIDSVMS